jgi:hypothetical protein
MRGRQGLPPELAHLAAGPMATALAKAVDFAQASVSPRTDARRTCGLHGANRHG